ncbi:MAG: Uma2 family endonuclease [Synechococcus sp.]|nr:Uma2 family endonuclease [Synechococcus sp.]
MVASVENTRDKKAIAPWVAAEWETYQHQRDLPTDDLTKQKLYFYQHSLLIEMGAEGINHASVNNLFTLLIGFWLAFNPEITGHLMGGCQLEKTSQKIAAAPDLVLYLGGDHPVWKQGDRRYLNLDEWRVPDLVGEISDTTIFHDLDRKKEIYAALGIPEYWVIDVQAQRFFLLVLNEAGRYESVEHSQVLKDLPKALLEDALDRLVTDGNAQVAQWFMAQLQGI